MKRAVDQDGDEIKILVQKRKNKAAAIRFFKRLLKGQGGMQLMVIVDKLKIFQLQKRINAKCRALYYSV